MTWTPKFGLKGPDFNPSFKKISIVSTSKLKYLWKNNQGGLYVSVFVENAFSCILK